MRTKEEVRADFADGLKEFMRRKGLTYRELSKLMDISTTNILDWRNGKTVPSLDKLTALLGMGMKLEEAFGWEFCEEHFRPKGAPDMGTADASAYDVMEYGLMAMLSKLRSDRRKGR